MKRTPVAVAAACVIASIAFVSIAASAATGKKSTTIHVVEVAKNVGAVSVGTLVGSSGSGPNRGDYAVLADPLLKPGTKQVVGHAYTVCYVANPKELIDYCTADYVLPGGHIEAQGVAPQKPRSFVVGITGGTGSYLGARGQATYTAIGNPTTATSFDWVLTLTN